MAADVLIAFPPIHQSSDQSINPSLFRTIMKVSLLLCTLLGVSHAWISQQSKDRALGTRLYTSESAKFNNPCWEDLYDDDCAMSNAVAANFVAADWIKSMPCGQGIEVSSNTLLLLGIVSVDRSHCGLWHDNTHSLTHSLTHSPPGLRHAQGPVRPRDSPGSRCRSRRCHVLLGTPARSVHKQGFAESVGVMLLGTLTHLFHSLF